MTIAKVLIYDYEAPTPLAGEYAHIDTNLGEILTGALPQLYNKEATIERLDEYFKKNTDWNLDFSSLILKTVEIKIID